LNSLAHNSYLHLTDQSQSFVITDGRSASLSWCRGPSRAQDQYFVTVRQLRVCRLQLLALASAVILGSESRGTHDHILLSHILDSPNLEGQAPVFIPSDTGFPLHRLLLLVGLRLRYSNPPPRRADSLNSSHCLLQTTPRYVTPAWASQKTRLPTARLVRRSRDSY
jgi:hypothetical protein